MDTFPNFNEYLDGACNQSEQIRKQAELSIGQAKEADTVSKNHKPPCDLPIWRIWSFPRTKKWHFRGFFLLIALKLQRWRVKIFVKDLAASNFFLFAFQTKFICSLIKELCDESNSAGCRQMASVVFKNTLINAT